MENIINRETNEIENKTNWLSWTLQSNKILNIKLKQKKTGKAKWTFHKNKRKVIEKAKRRMITKEIDSREIPTVYFFK